MIQNCSASSRRSVAIFTFLIILAFSSIWTSQQIVISLGDIETSIDYTRNLLNTENFVLRTNVTDAITKNLGSIATSPNKNATIVVQLSGEMANNLGMIAFGYSIQLRLQEEFHLNSELWLRHQTGVTKWKRAKSSLQQCFPFARGLDFQRGNTKEYLNAKVINHELLGPEFQRGIKSGRQEMVSDSLKRFVDILQWEDLHAENVTIRNVSLVVGPHNNPKSSISIPFLHADRMIYFDHWLDRYYDKFREFFQFDYDNQPSCCNPDIKIDPDESIFHLRNFKGEMPNMYKELGFQELGPNQVANELFAHLKPGDKVAIVTRSFGDDHNDIDPYVKSLQKRGLVVRAFTENTGVQDFCILLKAQKEIVGSSKSTYLRWGGILGSAKKVRVYSVDSPERRMAIQNGRPGGIFAKYDFQHPELKNRFVFELFTSNYTVDPGWR